MGEEDIGPCNHPLVSSDTPRPRWFDHRDIDQRHEYSLRFVTIAQGGDDVDGEARFIDAMAERGSRVLDAGCGTGRVAAALARAGHRVVGIDADPILIAKGNELYPGLPLSVLDLHDLTDDGLAGRDLVNQFDLVVCAGNVMLFLAEGTEPRVVANLAGVLAPGGRAVFGFFTGRDFNHDDLDDAAREAGLEHEHRFADWELRPARTSDEWAVSVYAKPR